MNTITTGNASPQVLREELLAILRCEGLQAAAEHLDEMAASLGSLKSAIAHVHAARASLCGAKEAA